MSIVHFFSYYQSFIKIVLLDKSPKNKLDLFHWSTYQLYNLWNKPIQSNGCTLKDLFKNDIQSGSIKASIIQKCVQSLLLTPLFVIIFQIMLPCIALCIGIFINKTYFKCIQYPYYLVFFQSCHTIEECIKNEFIENILLPQYFNFYIYNITGDENLCIWNKHLFNDFCVKYSIPTAKCIKTRNDLNQSKELEFIIKPVSLGCGFGIFFTKKPEKYLSQIPNIVIQPRLKNDKTIINFTQNGKTLNTFRICTFTKESNLKPFVFLSYVTNENCVVNNRLQTNKDIINGYSEYFYDMETKLFTKIINCNQVGRILRSISDEKSDTFQIEIEGLNEFINYVNNDIHHKYLNDIIGLGWDATKTSNGNWIIIECNISGYYYSDPTYSEKICQQYLKKIDQFKKHNKLR